MKRRLSLLLILTLIFCVFAGCNNQNGQTPVKTSEVKVSGFDTPTEVVDAYWNAFMNMSKDDLNACFIPEFSQANSSIVDSIYQAAVEADPITTYYYDGTKLSETPLKKSELKNNYNLVAQVSEGCLVYSAIRYDKVFEEGTDPISLEEYYEFTTVKYNGRWYIAYFEEAGVSIVSEEILGEDKSETSSEEIIIEENPEGVEE